MSVKLHEAFAWEHKHIPVFQTVVLPVKFVLVMMNVTLLAQEARGDLLPSYFAVSRDSILVKSGTH